MYGERWSKNNEFIEIRILILHELFLNHWLRFKPLNLLEETFFKYMGVEPMTELRREHNAG